MERASPALFHTLRSACKLKPSINYLIKKKMKQGCLWAWGISQAHGIQFGKYLKKLPYKPDSAGVTLLKKKKNNKIRNPTRTHIQIFTLTLLIKAID